MAGFVAEITGNVDELFDEANSGGGGSFPPLPAGRYQAIVVPLKKDGSQLTEVADFGGSGANAHKKIVRVAVRIVDESPTGAKRQYFCRVPLFTQYASGKAARGYFGFFGAMGATEEQLKKGQLPGPDDIIGKRLTITLSEPTEPDKWNPLGSNEVAFFNPAGSLVDTPKIVPGKPVADWLTPEGELTDEYLAANGDPSEAGATGTPQQSWEKPGASPWAQPGGAAGASPWAQQGDSALQAAANSGATF